MFTSRIELKIWKLNESLTYIFKNSSFFDSFIISQTFSLNPFGVFLFQFESSLTSPFSIIPTLSLFQVFTLRFNRNYDKHKKRTLWENANYIIWYSKKIPLESSSQFSCLKFLWQYIVNRWIECILEVKIVFFSLRMMQTLANNMLSR